MPSHDDYVYLAGIIDGEGAIMLSRSGLGFSLKLDVASTNKDLIDYLHLNFGGNIQSTVKSGNRGNRRDTWKWQLWGANMLPVLEEVLPYMIIKKQQALLALEYIENNPDGRTGGVTNEVSMYRNQMWDKFRMLNRRGLGALQPNPYTIK